MKILLIGSGGREHAIAWKLSHSPRVKEIVVAPGNAGMADVARVAPQPTGEMADFLALATTETPDLIVIGPEAPLVDGLVDRLNEAGFRVFGPTAAAARLEGSKAFAKEFMVRHGIATAEHRSFDDQEAALGYLRERGAPVVVKESGLAAGKGVTVAATLEAAEGAVRRAFGDGTNTTVVLEDFLVGQEFSYLVFSDGVDYLPLPIAQDYKQAEDGDRGPMTGGMGAVAPIELFDERTRAQIDRDIVQKTLAGLRKDDIEFRGVLYFGLMLTSDGAKLLEYNVRLGDPETQVVLPLLETDLLDVLESVVEGRVGETVLRWRKGAAACVVMAAPGYPGTYAKGIPLQPFTAEPNLLTFHAGTARESDSLVSSGGRVLNVVALAESVEEAVAAAYRGVDRVDFPGAHFRRDIGSRLHQG